MELCVSGVGAQVMSAFFCPLALEPIGVGLDVGISISTVHLALTLTCPTCVHLWVLSPAAASARFLETTLLLTLSRGLFELTPSPPVFATLRRLIGKCAPALVDASTDDGRSLAALYTLHVALQALHVVVKKAAAGAMSPSQSGFHAGEGSDDDLATASFMKQYVPRVALVGGCRC